MGSSDCNFQRGLLGSPHCRGCQSECCIVYDSHHDQYFSLGCGRVVMEMGLFCLDYYDNLELIFAEYEKRFVKQRLKREEEAKKRKKKEGVVS